MISNEELEAMRVAQESVMPETVYIQRVVRTSDNAGGWSEVWQTIATKKGRIVSSHRQGEEKAGGGVVTSHKEYIVTLPANTELRQDDRLQIAGEQYEVKEILERSKKTALQVICEKV